MKIKILIIMFMILISLPIVYPEEDVLIDTISALTITEDITSPMGKWEKFLNWIELIGKTIGFFVLVILFLLLFTGVWWIPLKIYPIISQHKKVIGQFINLRWK